MTDEPVLISVDRGVMTVTLNRPGRLNALTPAMRSGMLGALDRADADDDVRAVIFTGAGRGYCAGADISGGASGFVPENTDDGPWRDGGGLIALRLFESKKPVIGAINGAAVGVGVAHTLAMDYRLASTTARFGFVYTQRGIAPEACSSWFLEKIVGMPQALDWMLTGRVFDAEEALRTGLVRSLHAPEDLLPAAMKIARSIADRTSQVSVAITRRMLWRIGNAPHPRAAHEVESVVIPFRAASADAAEGVASFMEKRPAKFPGRVSKDIPPDLPLG